MNENKDSYLLPYIYLNMNAPNDLVWALTQPIAFLLQRQEVKPIIGMHKFDIVQITPPLSFCHPERK